MYKRLALVALISILVSSVSDAAPFAPPVDQTPGSVYQVRGGSVSTTVLADAVPCTDLIPGLPDPAHCTNIMEQTTFYAWRNVTIAVSLDANAVAPADQVRLLYSPTSGAWTEIMVGVLAGIAPGETRTISWVGVPLQYLRIVARTTNDSLFYVSYLVGR